MYHHVLFTLAALTIIEKYFIRSFYFRDFVRLIQSDTTF